jgi:hypothetical protein
VNDNPHFATIDTWDDAEPLVGFRPLVPRYLAGFDLQALRVHVMDHRRRDLPIEERTLEAHYGGFVLSEAKRGTAEARRLALDASYGAEPRETSVGGREARVYELGPEPEPDDPDGRMPALVAWADGELFLLVASGELSADELLAIAASF